ncbi:MAG: hypothetical protein ACI85K_001931 [Hyphomicrobiaceae bacterium]|jgi:hypothetical protein
MRTMIRAIGCCTGIALAAALSSCSVAVGLTSGEIIEELDEIVRIDGTDRERKIAYSGRARISSWYMHNALLIPVRAPAAWLFGRRTEMVLENAGQHVRELLKELPDETGSSLTASAAATSRFGWLAELDRNPQTRILAIDGLSRICQQLSLTPFAGVFGNLTTPINSETLALARIGIRTSRPSARGEDGGTLEPYRDALAQLSSAPLPRWDERLMLIEDLGVLLANETDARARPWLTKALEKSIEHCVRGVLLGTIKDRDSRWIEVRLCAMEQIRRLGGPRSVPLMLATMAASPQERSQGLSWFDPDPLIQLRLIHYCGQLSGELANTVVSLPGRQEWEATTPSDFLARTVLSERDYYSKLRTPAIVALSWSLGRKKIDPDPAWVRKWNEERR